MIEHYFAQTVLLLGVGVAIVFTFQRLKIPSSLAYLLVGLLLGPHTGGPVINSEHIHSIAEFGIVFLLFTIGLNFSLPQIHALRHQVLGLGTAQVVLTTLLIGLLAWMLGQPATIAFVIGAVFAQSSTTVISKQLTEQGEENSRHGRLGTAMSVFQDVTAVPFVLIIPILGSAISTPALAASLGMAMGKAVLAFALVFFIGRRLLRPLFQLVAERRSAELFTLTVLFVSLVAAWTTSRLGLSMAFGAFLAGMMLGETEFRHQVEATISPFRDVLLGLFFVGIGMLFDPSAIPGIWQWALLGTVALLSSKIILVAWLVRRSGLARLTSWRTGLLLAVGGEFGFALLAIALGANVLDPHIGQTILTSVLFSIIIAPFLIRYNHKIASWIIGFIPGQETETPTPTPATKTMDLENHVIICGYGRIGQSVAHFLEEEHIPHVALDLEASRVKEAHTAGEPVFYGDGANREILEAVGIHKARLIVISHEGLTSALKILEHAKTLNPKLPVMVTTRDESHAAQLLAAGAAEVVVETLEAGMMVASHALFLLNIPTSRIVRRVREQHAEHYPLLREVFRSDSITESLEERDQGRLKPVVLPPDSPAVGQPLANLSFTDVVITALVRDGERHLSPPGDLILEPGDAIVLFGTLNDLTKAEKTLLTSPLPRSAL